MAYVVCWSGFYDYYYTSNSAHNCQYAQYIYAHECVDTAYDVLDDVDDDEVVADDDARM